MPVWSFIQKSQLEGANRLDAEYFQPYYLDLERSVLKTNSLKKWGELGGRFITGPFGSEFNVENYDDNSEHRYVRGKDVEPFFLSKDDNVYIPRGDFERLKKYSLEENDVLVSVVGTLGNAAMVNSSNLPAIFSSKSTAFRARNINTLYLLTYLNSKYGRGLLLRCARGQVQTGLNIEDLKSLEVYLPSSKEQNEIATLVKESYELLEQSKSIYIEAENLLLEELGLSDFEIPQNLTYVVNFSETKKANRIDADYFQPKYEQLLSKLGKSKKRLIETAKRKTKQLRVQKDHEYNYIQISDINVGDGEVLSNKLLGGGLPPNAKTEIKGGELLVSKVRPTRGAVGIVPEEWKDNFIASSAFSVLETESPLRECLQVVLRSEVGKLQMERPTTGTSYPTITDQDIENIWVPDLPKSTQQKISDLVKKSHEARKKSKHLLEEAKRKVEEMIEAGVKTFKINFKKSRTTIGQVLVIGK